MGEMAVELPDVGGNPYAAFAVELSAVVVSAFVAAVVGSYDNHPLLVEMGFAILYSLPDEAHQLVGLADVAVHVSTVAEEMEAGVGIPQINPAEVGGVTPDTLGGLVADNGVDAGNVQLVGAWRETRFVELVAVVNVVDGQVAGFGLSRSD